MDALYTFRTAFSVVSSLETPKTDHDQKAAVNLNAFLKFESSTVALTNYLQKRDIDLLEVVTT